MINREFNKRRYENGIIGFELKLIWSDGRTEVVDEMPEYLQEELESFCEEYDQYRNENESEYK